VKGSRIRKPAGLPPPFASTQQQHSNGYPHVFGVKRFNGATSGIA